MHVEGAEFMAKFRRFRDWNACSALQSDENPTLTACVDKGLRLLAALLPGVDSQTGRTAGEWPWKCSGSYVSRRIGNFRIESSIPAEDGLSAAN